MTHPGTAPARRRPGIPDATVARLPLYLRALHALADEGVTRVSSDELAARVGSAGSPAKVRKDLSCLGSYGTRGVGYDVEQLVASISAELGLARRWPVVIVGVGNLGHALAGYGGFASRGFAIAALFDADPARLGEVVGGLPVRPMADLPVVVGEQGGAIGVIATPAEAAQDVCDELVAAGVRSILNFAPTGLQVPDGVDVRKVDLAVELQILSFHEHRKAARQVVPA
ncbi:MAG TPA: redox-sensing transcriptional repressor Rex [Mycobacteriales bacterium]|nr:redox-sensing transcriptional repressor Rex [Mycobacteriales bacterium]